MHSHLEDDVWLEILLLFMCTLSVENSIWLEIICLFIEKPLTCYTKLFWLERMYFMHFGKFCKNYVPKIQQTYPEKISK